MKKKVKDIDKIMYRKSKSLDKLVLSIGKIYMSILALFMFNLLFFISSIVGSLLLMGIGLICLMVMSIYYLVQVASIIGRVFKYKELMEIEVVERNRNRR